jgi:hypothetical protein
MRSPRWLRVSLRLSSVLVAFVGLYGLLLAFPEPLFGYRMEERPFVVYSRDPISRSAVAPLLREAERRLERSEIQTPGARHRVFVTGSRFLYRFFHGPYAGGMARNVELTHAILLPKLEERKGLVVHFDGRTAELAEILAHEATHTFVRERVGFLGALRLPFWKKEGYAEYVGLDFPPAAVLAQALVSSAGSSVELPDGTAHPRRYLEAAAVWAHFHEIRRESFDEILARSEPLDALLTEALADRKE